jgi:HSP20 family protein
MLFGFDVDAAFAELNELTRQIDGRVVRGLDGRHGLRAIDPMAAGFSEQEGALVWSADLPGVSREDVKITVENGILTLEAKRDIPKRDGAVARYTERRAWDVRRSVQLPETVDSEQIEAAFSDGVLTLRLPKKPEAKPRNIEIRVS